MEKTERKSPRTRSPAYPVIDLKEAISKAVTLWEKDKTNPIPRVVAFKHLGYGRGGYAGRVIAALRHFDLISEKSGDIVLTQNAVDLALYKPTDDEYINVVKKIALKPGIYRIIYNEYNGQLPSDDTLRIRLIKGYKFNPNKVVKFINDFRSTISFARLSEKESAEEIDEGEKEVMGGRVVADVSPKAPRITEPIISISYNVPLINQNIATINFQRFPNKKDLSILRKWLALFESSFIEDNDTQIMEELDSEGEE